MKIKSIETFSNVFVSLARVRTNARPQRSEDSEADGCPRPATESTHAGRGADLAQVMEFVWIKSCKERKFLP